jgi:hypothetical protein
VQVHLTQKPPTINARISILGIAIRTGVEVRYRAIAVRCRRHTIILLDLVGSHGQTELSSDRVRSREGTSSSRKCLSRVEVKSDCRSLYLFFRSSSPPAVMHTHPCPPCKIDGRRHVRVEHAIYAKQVLVVLSESASLSARIMLSHSEGVAEREDPHNRRRADPAVSGFEHAMSKRGRW